MSKLPPINRFVTEDFADQKAWVGKLLQPLNQFMESVYQALNRNVTVTENILADRLTIDYSGTAPVKAAWKLKSKPVDLFVTAVSRTDQLTQTFTFSSAPGVRWQYTQTGQIQIDQVVGLDTSHGETYRLTLLAFAE